MKSPNPQTRTHPLLPPRMLTHIPISKIEDTFTTTISDLHVIVVLDSIREISESSDAAPAGAPTDETADRDMNTYANKAMNVNADESVGVGAASEGVPADTLASIDEYATVPAGTPAFPGILIHSHDLYRPLPEIRIPPGERNQVLGAVAREASKLYAINRVREGISKWLHGCRFLPHTVLDDGVLVGVRWRKRAELAEAKSFWEAYLELREMV